VRTGKASFDPIALLEQAYRPCADPRAWLTANAPRLAACFDDHGIGCVSYFVRDLRFEPCEPAYHPGARARLAPGVALAALMTGARSASPAQARQALLAMQQPGVHGLLETFGEKLFPMEAFGVPIVDAPAIVVPTGEGVVAVIATFMNARVAVPRDQRVLWEAMAMHLGAACRLAGRPRDPTARDVEAVLSRSGKLLDARGAARRRTARELLRDAVVQRSRARTRSGRRTPHQALARWQALCGGRWSLVDLDDGGGEFLLACRNDPDRPGTAMSRRQRQVLFYASVGWSLKQIAYALGLSEGTISNHLAIALKRLGCPSRAELVRSTTEQMVSVLPRSPSKTGAGLSAAERDVARRVSAGWSNRQIADSRGVSHNTVGNQLATIYRKLGIRDRHELIRELTKASAVARQ
jgi:DNA-binding CsgD family transcriptional regulator